MKSSLRRMQKFVFTSCLCRLIRALSAIIVMTVTSMVIYVYILHFVITLEDTETLLRLLHDWDQVDNDSIKLCDYLFGQKYY